MSRHSWTAGSDISPDRWGVGKRKEEEAVSRSVRRHSLRRHLQTGRVQPVPDIFRRILDGGTEYSELVRCVFLICGVRGIQCCLLARDIHEELIPSRYKRDKSQSHLSAATTKALSCNPGACKMCPSHTVVKVNFLINQDAGWNFSKYCRFIFPTYGKSLSTQKTSFKNNKLGRW